MLQKETDWLLSWPRTDERNARESCFPVSLKSKKKYAMCADPASEMRSISWMIAELVIVDNISTLAETSLIGQRT